MAELQAVAAKGINLDVVQSPLVWLVGVGGGSEVRVALTRTSGLVLSGWLLWPTSRPKFVTNAEELHRPAPVYGWLSLGASFRLLP